MNNKPDQPRTDRLLLEIEHSSIIPMLDNCQKLLRCCLTEDLLLRVLDHDTYNFEFSRYDGMISKAEYKEYFLNFPDIEEKSITNPGLKAHHIYYQHLFDNLELYKTRARELSSKLEQVDFSRQIALARKGLPDELNMPVLRYHFSIGIGPSFGYVFKNGMHFDFLHIVRDDISPEILGATIAHETHHVGMNVLFDNLNFEQLSLEEQFYLFFAGEGLAVKYCNNAQGVISCAINEGPTNIGLDHFSWEYLNNDFDNTMAQFQETLRKIRNHEIDSSEKLHHHIRNYWMKSHTESQQPEEIPGLQQFRLYSLGNDIWGVIHDSFGKEVVYETINNPQSFPEIFNQAVRNIGREELQI